MMMTRRRSKKSLNWQRGPERQRQRRRRRRPPRQTERPRHTRTCRILRPPTTHARTHAHAILPPLFHPKTQPLCAHEKNASGAFAAARHTPPPPPARRISFSPHQPPPPPLNTNNNAARFGARATETRTETQRQQKREAIFPLFCPAAFPAPPRVHTPLRTTSPDEREKRDLIHRRQEHESNQIRPTYKQNTTKRRGR